MKDALTAQREQGGLVQGSVGAAEAVATGRRVVRYNTSLSEGLRPDWFLSGGRCTVQHPLIVLRVNLIAMFSGGALVKV